MTRIWKRIAAAVALALATVAVVVAPATPAAGSAEESATAGGTPLCVKRRAVSRPSGFILVPAASSDSTNCLIGDGLVGSNAAVLALQRGLICSGQNIEDDGFWGPQTRQAVRNVQSRGGITVDGIYGPRTRNVMSWPFTNPETPSVAASCQHW